MFKCVCGKSFDNKNALSNHQRACFQFHKGKDYSCECGIKFSTPAKRSSHYKYCKIYCENHNKEIRDPKKDKGNLNRGWNRGKTKDDPIYGESIKRAADSLAKYWKTHYEDRKQHLKNMTKNRTSLSFQKQSETRKRKYEDGSLKPAIGVGRGDTCCLIYKQKEFWFRSSYEFIFGLYLCSKNKDFDYENIRITKNGKTYFNDFYVDGNIIEVKGYQTNKDKIEQKVFESEGYKFSLLTYREIEEYKCELEKTIEDIDSLLKLVHQKSKEKDYLIYDFSKKSII